METRNLEQLKTIANACNAASCTSLDSNGEVLDELTMLAETGQLSGGDGSITIDNALSETSYNPVQNRVIARLVPAEANSGNRLTDKAYVDAAFDGKVDKETGKGLSTNDYTDADKAKLASLENYDDSNIHTQLSKKVDKVSGKQLSTNDFTNDYKSKLDSLENYNDTSLKNQINNKADVDHIHDDLATKSELNTGLNNKVDKEIGKGLSTNDFTDELKLKLETMSNGGGNDGSYDDSALIAAISNKVEKVEGKQLSTNDFTNEDKAKLDSLENYDDTEVKNQIAAKVDIIEGKGLSTNDFTDEDKERLDSIHNYDDSELREAVNNKADLDHTHDYISSSVLDSLVLKNELTEGLATKADTSHTHDNYATKTELDNKVDKVEGKGLSTNDYTTEEKERLASLHNYDDSELRAIIPEDASEENKLADKNYVNTQTANRQVKFFNNANGSEDKWYKICSALTTGIGCNIKLTAGRVDATVTVQYFSALFRDNRYRYTSTYLTKERNVYETELASVYRAYIIADANNDIWVHVPSYGKAIIEIDTKALIIDGTVGTPVKDFVYNSLEHQIDEDLEKINIKQFNNPGSNTVLKYVTITSSGNGLGGVELNSPYAGKYMFSVPKSSPIYFGSENYKGYTLNGWAWSDDGKTLYLRVSGFIPFSISVLGAVTRDAQANNIATISGMSSTAPEGVTFVSTPLLCNAVIEDTSTIDTSTWSSSKIASEISALEARIAALEAKTGL